MSDQISFQEILLISLRRVTDIVPDAHPFVQSQVTHEVYQILREGQTAIVHILPDGISVIAAEEIN